MGSSPSCDNQCAASRLFHVIFHHQYSLLLKSFDESLKTNNYFSRVVIMNGKEETNCNTQDLTGIRFHSTPVIVL